MVASFACYHVALYAAGAQHVLIPFKTRQSLLAGDIANRCHQAQKGMSSSKLSLCSAGAVV
jgi:hypothetical protein